MVNILYGSVGRDLFAFTGTLFENLTNPMHRVINNEEGLLRRSSYEKHPCLFPLITGKTHNDTAVVYLKHVASTLNFLE